MCFIKFNTTETAVAALANMNGTEICGR